MNNKKLYEDIGYRIRAFRRNRGMSISELAGHIGKSIATVSKYESGDVTISADVLVDICACLSIEPGTLLPTTVSQAKDSDATRYENYYEDNLYIYWYNGEQNRVRSAFIDNTTGSRTHSILYFDINSPDDIEKATYIYVGEMDYSDTGTVFLYTNSLPPFDKMALRVPSFTRGHPYRTGLVDSISLYYQSVATKIIITSSPVKDPTALMPKLKLSREELQRVRKTNLLIV